jgi:hypothetical protein
MWKERTEIVRLVNLFGCAKVIEKENLASGNVTCRKFFSEFGNKLKVQT